MLDYEQCTRYLLPSRTFKILRLDGRAFHTVLRNVTKPHDYGIAQAMAKCMLTLMRDIGGTARFGYTQSDEVSILLTESLAIETQQWFNGNIQKIVSVAASSFTLSFRKEQAMDNAMFDARIFVLPDITEVVNYFISRQQDGIRNSVSQCARSFFSAEEMLNKKGFELKAMMCDKGFNWDSAPFWQQRGTCAFKIAHPTGFLVEDWSPPIFTEERNYIERCGIPQAETIINNDTITTVDGAPTTG